MEYISVANLEALTRGLNCSWVDLTMTPPAATRFSERFAVMTTSTNAKPLTPARC